MIMYHAASISQPCFSCTGSRWTADIQVGIVLVRLGYHIITHVREHNYRTDDKTAVKSPEGAVNLYLCKSQRYKECVLGFDPQMQHRRSEMCMCLHAVM